MIVTAVGGSTAFLLNLYQKDKLNGILQSRLNGTKQTASHLANLIALVDIVEIDKARDSDTIIFIYDDPCSQLAKRKGIVSHYYENQLREIEVPPEAWLDSLALFKTCSQLTESTSETKTQAGVEGVSLKAEIVPSKIQIMQPYIAVLTQSKRGRRFALISLQNLDNYEASTTFIINSNGETVWSADGAEYVQTAMLDTGVTFETLRNLSRESLKSDTAKVELLGNDGLISYAKVTDDWALMTLSYKPTAFKSVHFALRQSLLLILGFIFLCLFIGKMVAQLVTQPLLDLKRHAELVGQGNFETRLEVKGRDEIATVENAFNVMTDKIIQLIEDTKEKINIEKELELAEQTQKMLMPDHRVDLKDFRFSSYTQTASKCGGDWWGYLEIKRPNKKSVLLIMVGDVTGHGTSSALITASVHGGLSILSTWIEENPEIGTDPRSINQYFNRAVYESAKGVIGMTLFTAVVEPEAKLMYCSNAGHNLPYLISPDKDGKKANVKVLSRPGTPLGYVKDTVYTDLDTYEWTPGSQLFLYTDGLIDCTLGEKVLYDRKSLRKALGAYGHLVGADLMNQLLNDRSKKIGDLPTADDITAVICEFKDT